MSNDNEHSCFMDDRSNVNGFDLTDSQYDDLFALHQRLHEEGDAFDTLKEHFERFRETADGKRAMKRAETLRASGQMTFMLELMALTAEREDLGEQEYWRRASEQMKRSDPFVQESTVGGIGQMYDDMLHKATAGTATLGFVVGDEQAHELTKNLFVAVLRVLQQLQVTMSGLLRANMQRIADGCPDWDPETQTFVAGSGLSDITPIDLMTGQPYAGGGALGLDAPTSDISQEEQQAAQDALLSRLMNGLNLNF